MNNLELAEKIWDEVYAYKAEAHDPEKQVYADVMVKVVRHQMIQQIADVITRYS